MGNPNRRQAVRVLLAPTEAAARRLARLPGTSFDPAPTAVVARARATRTEAVITRAESELLRKRARRIVAASRRNLRDLAMLNGRWAAA